MSNLTQDNRFISITTPLGKDELLLTSFEGTEFISNLFEFQIETLSANHKITPEKIIGKTVTLTIEGDQKRTFNGYISNFTYGEIKGTLRSYSMSMVPWLWFLSKNSNNRIFQEMNTKDIVSSIFRELGFNDFVYKATGNPAPREYCVQYNETDLVFISRLLEEDGIAYFFEQKNDKHIMHIVDAINAYEECADTDLTYSRSNPVGPQITGWKHLYEFRTGKWSLDDHDFKKPKSDQLQSTSSTSKLANAKKYEHYEYIHYHDFSGIKDLSKKRIEAEEVSLNAVEGTGNCRSFYAGGKFRLSEHSNSKEKGLYAIIEIRHKADDDNYQTQSSSDSQTGYSNQFLCIPDAVHYRPPLLNPKPVMPGPQSAVVVGAAGEEIYVDKDKRIKVQFHWDRLGKKDEKTTCYIRVMQPWAGAGWGTSFIPRIGMEVVVNFFDGDPDRPVITGSVYNGDNKPPFESKTQSGIKTRSTKKGTSANYNELRFDDLKDSEQIFIHAEKNMDTEVENDETLTVDNDRTKIIKHDENSTIENDRNKTVNNNQTETIKKNKTIKVGVNHTESIDKNMTITVMGDLKESVDGKYSENVTKAYDMQAKTITMQASDQITLRTGAASIVMKSSGDITISGSTINVKGSGNVIIKGSKVTTN